MTQDELRAKYGKLIEAAKEAAKLAYCPYSSYPVGAAILTFDGVIYSGCNVENCSFTQTIHAEQTALVSAIADGAMERAKKQDISQLKFIEAIAVHAQRGKDPWPCCNCRQTLNEFGLDMIVVGEGPEGDIRAKTLRELIPHAFDMELVLESVRKGSHREAIAAEQERHDG